MQVTLPWPNRNLHPNARVHWSKRARSARIAREQAGWEAVQAGFEPMDAAALAVTLTFTPPDRRPRDQDGMLSNCKSYLDGIADVLGVDDSKWSISLRREPPRAPGAVRIQIEVTA